MTHSTPQASSSQGSYNKAPFMLYILNALALTGIGLSVSLTQHFYEVRGGISGFKTFCNIGEAMNCDVIAASPFAELISGFPLSSFSAGWFLALFLISLIAHNRFWRREAVRACLGMTAASVLIGLAYLFVMVFKLKTYCLFCLGVDGVSLLSFISALLLRPEGFSQHRPNPSQWKAILALGLGAVLVSVLGLKVLETSSYPSSAIEEVANKVLTSPVISVQAGVEFPSIGPKNAPITVVEFSDFQCPFCRMAAFSLHSVVNRYPQQIRVVFRNFPLDQSCNREIQQSAHPVACEAARVAICAHSQGKFKQIYEELFQNQAFLSPGKSAELAKEIGLDLNQIQGCADSPETASRVSRDIEEAIALGIQSTPTFFVNGHKAEGAIPPSVWIKIVDRLLEKP